MSTDTETDAAPGDAGLMTEAESDEQEKKKLSLDVKVDEPSPCQRHVTVTVSREDVDRYLKDAVDELMPKAVVPGFRPGRAPRKLVQSRFRDQTENQVKGSLLMDSMEQVGEEHDFAAISEPDFDFDAVEIPDEGPMMFEFDVEVRPDFDMPEWKGLKLQRPVREVTDQDIRQHMELLLKRHGTLVPRDEPAAADDHVIVNLTFRRDGEIVSRLREQSIEVKPKLSFADGTLEGFDRLVIGAEADDKKQTKIKLSEDSPRADMRGAELDVEVEILDVKRLELPALTGQFLDRLGGFESEDELREAVQAELQRQFIYHQQKSIRQQITSSLTAAADWQLPPDMLKKQAKRELERSVLELQRSGFSQQEIQRHANELRQNSLATTATALREHFILERIAEAENLGVTPADYDQEIELIARQENQSPRRVRARLEKRGLMDTLHNQIIERKAIERIMANATIQNVQFQPPADDTVAIDHLVGGGVESDIPEAKHGEEVELPGQEDRS